MALKFSVKSNWKVHTQTLIHSYYISALNFYFDLKLEGSTPPKPNSYIVLKKCENFFNFTDLPFCNSKGKCLSVFVSIKDQAIFKKLMDVCRSFILLNVLTLSIVIQLSSTVVEMFLCCVPNCLHHSLQRCFREDFQTLSRFTFNFPIFLFNRRHPCTVSEVFNFCWVMYVHAKGTKKA